MQTKIALGTWAWGAGAFGGDAVFGSRTDVENLKPAFGTIELHSRRSVIICGSPTGTDGTPNYDPFNDEEDWTGADGISKYNPFNDEEDW